MWHKLWTNFCIPKQYIIQVVELLIQRLDDKSALVVKFTVQLLQIIVQTNPYGLNVSKIKTTHYEYYFQLQILLFSIYLQSIMVFTLRNKNSIELI